MPRNMLAYLEGNWKTASIFRSLSPATWVSWRELILRCLQGGWRVTRQCVWGLFCATDHADWWELTASYRRSREQCCRHVLSPADLSESREDVRSHRLCHTDDAVHRQKPLSTVKRFFLHAEWRHQLMMLPVRHPRQQQLKQDIMCCCFLFHFISWFY